MKILICIVILLAIFVLMMLGLLVMNEVVEDLKKINEMRRRK